MSKAYSYAALKDEELRLGKLIALAEIQGKKAKEEKAALEHIQRRLEKKGQGR